MTTERRYNEQEIAAIFEHAAADLEAARRHLPPGGGLTLAELEEIGQEAGIPPAFIARAAAVATADQSATTPPPTTFLGLPVSVARSVDLPGPFSDEDWDRLVTDLHDTFHVYGEIRRNGALRQWQYGNLQAVVEPTETGHRLRLRTLSDRQRSLLTGGLVFFLMGLVFILAVATKGGFLVDFGESVFVSLFALAGLGSLGLSAYQLPRWRKERARQMERITARAVNRAVAQHAPALPASAPSLPLDPASKPAPESEVEQPRTRSRVR